jgi:hypothetical protein
MLGADLDKSKADAVVETAVRWVQRYAIWRTQELAQPTPKSEVALLKGFVDSMLEYADPGEPNDPRGRYRGSEIRLETKLTLQAAACLLQKRMAVLARMKRPKRVPDRTVRELLPELAVYIEQAAPQATMVQRDRFIRAVIAVSRNLDGDGVNIRLDKLHDIFKRQQ